MKDTHTYLIYIFHFSFNVSCRTDSDPELMKHTHIHTYTHTHIHTLASPYAEKPRKRWSGHTSAQEELMTDENFTNTTERLSKTLNRSPRETFTLTLTPTHKHALTLTHSLSPCRLTASSRSRAHTHTHTFFDLLFILFSFFIQYFFSNRTRERIDKAHTPTH